MEFLKSIRLPSFKKIPFIGMYLPFGLIVCSQFNQPVQPIVTFSPEEYDYYSGSSASFNYNGKVFTILPNWDIDSDHFPMKVKVFVKRRNENEFITEPLSGLTFDRYIEINLAKSVTDNDLVAFYTMYDGRGDTLYNRLTWSVSDRRISIVFDDTLRTDFSLFYWQTEFYDNGDTLDTLRIPEMPVIWYFTYSDW